MIRRDYHGFTVKLALQDLEELITGVRMNALPTKLAKDAEFIVGHGQIRKELIQRLEFYGCAPRQKLGNQGIIVCVIQ